ATADLFSSTTFNPITSGQMYEHYTRLALLSSKVLSPGTNDTTVTNTRDGLTNILISTPFVEQTDNSPGVLFVKTFHYDVDCTLQIISGQSINLTFPTRTYNDTSNCNTTAGSSIVTSMVSALNFSVQSGD